jgi:hypothetical protein
MKLMLAEVAKAGKAGTGAKRGKKAAPKKK